MGATGEKPDAQELAHQLQARSSTLNSLRTLPEVAPSSRVPVLGPFLILLQRLANRLATRWYVAPLVERQQRFNEQVTAAFDEVAAAVTAQAYQAASLYERTRTLSASRKELGCWRCEPPGTALPTTSSRDQEEVAALFQLSADALRAWEQADCPEGLSTCHESEAADLQDADLGMNFPLDWLVQDVGWNYLLHMAVVGPALACRPGDRVLDFAGGSGWASELLNRFGVNTVLLDYSNTPLRHSRLRFGADRRLLRHAQVHAVRGDCLRLPFPDATFDGILCMNAFHHMPSYEASLQEMARVLKPGCRAAFGEPGEGHARMPVSRWTMEELRVYEKNVPLDLVYVYAMRSGFSRMWRYPYTYPARVELPYPETGRSAPTILGHLQQVLPVDLPTLSLFALEKEGERPTDSSSPRSVLNRHRLHADITLLSSSETVRAGAALVDRVRIRNCGDVIWLAGPAPMGGYVRLGVKLCDSAGRQLSDALPRPSFAQDVRPGEELELDVPLTAPTIPGEYILRYDLVDEWRTWFEEMGSRVVDRRFVVLG